MSLQIPDLSDANPAENFKRLKEYMQKALEQDILAGFQHFEVNLTAATEYARIAHNLGFIPRDIIRTFYSGTGTFTFHYDRFDEKYMVVSATSACTVRGFIGSHRGSQ